MDEKTHRLTTECEADVVYDSVIESHAGSHRSADERLLPDAQDRLRHLLGSPE